MNRRDQLDKISARFRDAIMRIGSSERPVALQSFPHGACQDASLLLGTLLQERGFDGFCLVRGERASDQWTHAWLSDGLLIVDITIDQFPEAAGKPFVTSDSSWHDGFYVLERSGDVDFRDYEYMCGVRELLEEFYLRLQKLV